MCFVISWFTQWKKCPCIKYKIYFSDHWISEFCFQNNLAWAETTTVHREIRHSGLLTDITGFGLDGI